MMDIDEILDVVSEQDEVLYQATRSEIYAKKLNFRVVNAFICNSEGKLWIPRRHHNKKLFPLGLDCSVGGHVSAGEDYETALIRETQEELTITLEKADYKKIARLTPRDHGTSSFMWVYMIYSDVTPAYNKNDFIEYYWLTLDEVVERLNNHDHGKYDLLPILKEIRGKF